MLSVKISHDHPNLAGSLYLWAGNATPAAEPPAGYRVFYFADIHEEQAKNLASACDGELTRSFSD
jgi:hypothetical protein